MAEVFIGFGSNLGNRPENIRQALKKLKDHPKISVAKISSLYESEPVEMKSHHPFLNGVVQIQTVLTPQKLSGALEEIEDHLGRPKTEKGQKLDRTIDLDVLFYNDLIFSIPGLTVPHPHAHRRKFVLLPMLEISPDFEHPLFRVSLPAFLDDLKTKEKVEICPSSTISL